MAFATQTSTPTRSGLKLLVWLQWLTSNFLVRTLLKMLLIIWVVVSLTFVIVRALPGNPVDIFVLKLMDSGMSEDEAKARAAQLLHIDLKRPLGAQ